MTSLSSEGFNIANIKLTNSDIYSIYTTCGVQRQYAIKQLYNHQMRRRMADKPNSSQKENWAWFKSTQYYTQSSLYNYYAQIKANKPIKFLLKNSQTTPSLHQDMANEIGKISYQYNYSDVVDALYDILDMMSSRGDSPDIFKEFAYFIGHILA